MSVHAQIRPLLRKLLKPDGPVIDYPPQGKHYTLEEVQKAVEGYIEILHLKGGYLMVVNEEGKLKDLPINRKATEIYASTWDHIVGNALVCRTRDVD